MPLSRFTDPRDIRKLLAHMSRTGYWENEDGTRADMSAAAALIHRCRQLSEAMGLSGEDEFAVLAYNALQQFEKLARLELNFTAMQSHTGPADVAQLMKFYSVSTLEDLVQIQSRHIERLQSKLPPSRPDFGNPREG